MLDAKILVPHSARYQCDNTAVAEETSVIVPQTKVNNLQASMKKVRGERRDGQSTELQ